MKYVGCMVWIYVHYGNCIILYESLAKFNIHSNLKDVTQHLLSTAATKQNEIMIQHFKIIGLITAVIRACILKYCESLYNPSN